MSNMKLNISLELSREDLERALNMFDADGTNIKEVLEGFINDLVCGNQRHGSDECDRAKSYYERCCYDLCATNSFVHYLLTWGEMECVIEKLEDNDSIEEYMKEYPAEAEICKEDIADNLNDIKEFYYDEYAEQFTRRNNPVPESFEEALENVRAWKKSRDEFMQSVEEI